MVELLDLRKLDLTQFDYSMDGLENQIEIKLQFLVTDNLWSKVISIIDLGKAVDITYRGTIQRDEGCIDETICRDCFVTGYTYELGPADNGLSRVDLDFVTSNAGMRTLSVLRSKEGKEMIVELKLAEKVKKITGGKKIPFKRLEEIVLAHMI